MTRQLRDGAHFARTDHHTLHICPVFNGFPRAVKKSATWNSLLKQQLRKTVHRQAEIPSQSTLTIILVNIKIRRN